MSSPDMSPEDLLQQTLQRIDAEALALCRDPSGPSPEEVHAQVVEAHARLTPGFNKVCEAMGIQGCEQIAATTALPDSYRDPSVWPDHDGTHAIFRTTEHPMHPAPHQGVLGVHEDPAHPGGRLPQTAVFLSPDMGRVLGTGDRIASITAHEMAHIVIEHGDAQGQEWRSTDLAQWMHGPVAPVPNDTGPLNASQMNEAAADRLGAVLLAEAGYPPDTLESTVLRSGAESMRTGAYRLGPDQCSQEDIEATKSDRIRGLVTKFALFADTDRYGYPVSHPGLVRRLSLARDTEHDIAAGSAPLDPLSPEQDDPSPSQDPIGSRFSVPRAIPAPHSGSDRQDAPEPARPSRSPGLGASLEPSSPGESEPGSMPSIRPSLRAPEGLAPDPDLDLGYSHPGLGEHSHSGVGSGVGARAAPELGAPRQEPARQPLRQREGVSR